VKRVVIDMVGWQPYAIADSIPAAQKGHFSRDFLKKRLFCAAGICYLFAILPINSDVF
jgi:hypothetical protein